MTIVRGRWFPAAVTLPGQSKPWSRCYVLAADDGLHIFKQRAERAGWHSPVEWATTTLPTTDKQARRGFDVHTDAGLVVVTAGTPCRCGTLGTWRGPEWATTEQAKV